MQNRLIQFGLVGIWLASVAVGLGSLLLYANTPGAVGPVLAHWPQASAIAPAKNLPTLVVFAHPKCSCSDATLSELERVMTHLQGKVKAYVVFFRPQEQSDDWAQKGLWGRAGHIPGVEAILDIDGVEAQRFGALTSGQAFLYSSDGGLAFHGGITSARGHEGDNRGSDSILAYFKEGFKNVHQIAAESPVFGCSIMKKD